MTPRQLRFVATTTHENYENLPQYVDVFKMTEGFEGFNRFKGVIFVHGVVDNVEVTYCSECNRETSALSRCDCPGPDYPLTKRSLKMVLLVGNEESEDRQPIKVILKSPFLFFTPYKHFVFSPNTSIHTQMMVYSRAMTHMLGITVDQYYALVETGMFSSTPLRFLHCYTSFYSTSHLIQNIIPRS